MSSILLSYSIICAPGFVKCLINIWQVRNFMVLKSIFWYNTDTEGHYRLLAPCALILTHKCIVPTGLCKESGELLIWKSCLRRRNSKQRWNVIWEVK